jgi:hypothetical protein
MRKNLLLVLLFFCLCSTAGAQCLPVTTAVEDSDQSCIAPPDTVGCHMELNNWPDGALVSINLQSDGSLIVDTTMGGVFGDGGTSSGIICVPCQSLYISSSVFNQGGCLLTTDPPVVLTVTLSHFTVVSSSDGNALSWTVNMEQANVQYIVQRSADCRSYMDIAHVNGTGYGDMERVYSYTDALAVDSSYCYRLKAIETDGAVTYSPVVLSNKQVAESAIKVYPNPVTSNGFKITIPSVLLPAQAMMTNTEGQLLYHGTITEATTTINALLPGGIYLLKIAGNNNSSTIIKIIKQ